MDDRRMAQLRLGGAAVALLVVLAAGVGLGLSASSSTPERSGSTATVVVSPTATDGASSTLVPPEGADGVPPGEAPVPSRPQLDAVWVSPGSPDSLVAAESWVTALHTWDSSTSTPDEQVEALLGWVGEEMRDTRIRWTDTVSWLSAAEAAEVVVGTEAVWANRRDVEAFSVFSPTLTRLAEPSDTDAGEAFFEVLDRAGVDLVWVEGLRIEVRGGQSTEHVERELLYVGRADGPGRTATGEAWVIGAMRGLKR